MRLDGNAGRKNWPKIRRLHTMAQICRAISLQLRHASTIEEKNLLSSNFSSTSPHNTVNFRPTNGWDRLASLGHPRKFQRVLPLGLVRHRRQSTEVNQAFHDVRPSAGLVRYVYILGRFCPITEFCQVQNSLCVQVLRSFILAALLHGTGAVGVSQTLWRSADGATYIFGRAVNSLDIGPHSSNVYFLLR